MVGLVERLCLTTMILMPSVPIVVIVILSEYCKALPLENEKTKTMIIVEIMVKPNLM